VDNIKSIFTTTEEEAVRRPTGSRTRAQTPVALDTAVSPPNIISSNSKGSTINIGGKDVSVGYGAGQVDPGIINRMQKNKEGKDVSVGYGAGQVDPGIVNRMQKKVKTNILIMGKGELIQLLKQPQKPQIKRKKRIKRIEMKVELDLQKEHWRLVVQELVKFLVTLLPVVKQKEKVTLQL
jgi:hypothetical protein